MLRDPVQFQQPCRNIVIDVMQEDVLYYTSCIVHHAPIFRDVNFHVLLNSNLNCALRSKLHLGPRVLDTLPGSATLLLHEFPRELGTITFANITRALDPQVPGLALSARPQPRTSVGPTVSLLGSYFRMPCTPGNIIASQ